MSTWRAPTLGLNCYYRVYAAGGAFTDYAAIIQDVDGAAAPDYAVSLLQFQKSGAPISRTGVKHRSAYPATPTSGTACWLWAGIGYTTGVIDCNDPTGPTSP